MIYEKALSQRPHDPLGIHGAALARAGVGDTVAAGEYYRRLQRIDPAGAARLREELATIR